MQWRVIKSSLKIAENWLECQCTSCLPTLILANIGVSHTVPRQIIVIKGSQQKDRRSMDCKTIRSQDIFGGFAPRTRGLCPNHPNVNIPQNPQNFQITIKVMFAIICPAIHWAAILLLQIFWFLKIFSKKFLKIFFIAPFAPHGRKSGYALFLMFNNQLHFST